MKHRARHAAPPSVVRVRPLPLLSTVRLRRPLDIWHKHAFSAAAALAVPDVVLLVLGRLDLVLYTSAGAMCALYAHGLPYAARARTLVWLVLGMAAGLGVALASASLIASPVPLVLLASLVAAVHKVVCDATRIGPPANVVLTFLAASAFFVPQRLTQVPGHLLLVLGGGAVAWLVCMAPALVRPRGPERIATARALESAATLLTTGAGAGAAGAGTDSDTGRGGGTGSTGEWRSRHATAAAVNAAWHTLFLVPARSEGRTRPEGRTALERLLVRAESVLALGDTGGSPSGRDAEGPRRADEAARLTGWARELRRGGPVPLVGLDAEQAGQLLGVVEERTAFESPAAPSVPRRGPYVPHRPAPGGGLRGIGGAASRLRRGSPLLPVGARVAVSCTLAGWASLAAGVGHPYWAVVTAASLCQANFTLTWQRALQRVLGNLLGLLLFTALVPLTHAGATVMVALALACQIGAEAAITRNYWLGSVCVTPMALLLSEFGSRLPAGQLVGDRWTDTLIGAAVGLLCCAVVTNRRATTRIETALTRVSGARALARALLREGAPADAGRERDLQAYGRARDELVAALCELREAVEVASGEWWQRTLPERELERAEREGHRELARLVRRLTPPAVPAA